MVPMAFITETLTMVRADILREIRNNLMTIELAIGKKTHSSLLEGGLPMEQLAKIAIEDLCDVSPINVQ